jgi:serine/threonine protein kinase
MQINEKNVVKIRFSNFLFFSFSPFILIHYFSSDFGLARFYEMFYQPQSETAIPVRWSAPEVLQQARVTSKSDVFSFGVCMWEILEHGTRKKAAAHPFFSEL